MLLQLCGVPSVALFSALLSIASFPSVLAVTFEVYDSCDPSSTDVIYVQEGECGQGVDYRWRLNNDGTAEEYEACPSASAEPGPAAG